MRPGDRVARGDIVAVVETQKAAIEIEIFDAGVVEELVVAEGEKVPVGTVLARLRTDGEVVAPPAQVSPPAMTRQRVSPAARRRARELDVDVSGLTGTGPHGAISIADIEAAAAKRKPEPKPRPKADRQAGIRAAIAAAMTRSKREIPHYYLQHTINVGAMLRWLEARNADRPAPERVLPAAVLLAAVGRALAEFPDLNGTYEDGAFRPSEAVHIGMAVALRGGGVIAPAIHDAHRRSVDELMRALLDVVERARAGRLRSSELGDPTITITSLGDRGPELVYGVITPPQVAAIGFGAIARRPWVVEGGVIAQPLVTATLSGDHRVSDGHRGGLLLIALDRRLQAPEEL